MTVKINKINKIKSHQNINIQSRPIVHTSSLNWGALHLEMFLDFALACYESSAKHH